MGIRFASGIVGSMLALCAACGGGGGASTTNPPPQPPPIAEPAGPVINYTGSRQSIAVSKLNAAGLSYRALALLNVSGTLEHFWVDPPQGPFKSEWRDFGEYGGEVGLHSEIDINGRGYVEAVFRDLSDAPDESVNGRLLLRYRPEPGGTGGTEFSFAGPGYLEFDNFQLTQGALSTVFHGVFRISGSNSNTFNVDMMVTDGATGDTLYFENCRIDFSEVSVGGYNRPGLELSGTVFDSNEGGIGFSPLGPVPDLGYSDLAGYLLGGGGGGIELLSTGPVTHFRPISFAFASIVMDMDGDGTPETARRYSWPELSGETNLESSVITGPIANAGNRRTASPGLPVNMHGLFSHDDDGDWLNFNWKIIAKPGQSSVSTDKVSTDPYFEFRPDVAGDYVFGLRVSDSRSASETSVTIRYAPAEAGDGLIGPSGGLEIGQPIASSVPIEIDGTSSVSWPYGSSPPFWLRAGFGPFSFGDTGSSYSTYFNVQSEGLNTIQFSHSSEFSGAPNSNAEINLAVGPTIFETRIDLAAAANAYDLHELDYDGDGDPDLVLRTGTNGDERLLVLLSTPQGLAQGPDLPAGRGEIAIGDINGDGLPDFLNAAEDRLLIFLQNPDHSLAEPASMAYPLSACAATGRPTDIALADVNGDVRIDIVAVHPCENAVVIWLQNAAGGFTAPGLTVMDNHRIESAAIGDIDGDGRADVVASLSATSTVYPAGVAILIAQQDGTIVQRDFIENTGIINPGVAVGDVNNDQRNDLVIIGSSEISILYQAVNGSLGASVVYSDHIGPTLQPTVSLLDMDGDNRKDIFFCDSGPSMRMLLQGQGGEFTDILGPRCPYLSPYYAEIAVSHDLNGDGYIDLLTVSDEARGAIDERVLLNVYLRNVHSYPIAVME